jgi:general secretion pathway protein G
MERRKSGEASENGFTLIELLIVIIVLGILAAIVVFSLSGVTGESKQAACTSDAKSVEIAADAYEAANNNAWPANITPDLTGDATHASYLHSAPLTTNGYTISLGTTAGNVLYLPTGDTTAKVFNDGTGCQGVS